MVKPVPIHQSNANPMQILGQSIQHQSTDPSPILTHTANPPILVTSYQSLKSQIAKSYFQIDTAYVNSVPIQANQTPIQVTIPHLVKGTSSTGDRLVSTRDDYTALSCISAHYRSYQPDETSIQPHDCQSNANPTYVNPIPFSCQFKPIQYHSVANQSNCHSITILLFQCHPTTNPLPIHRQSFTQPDATQPILVHSVYPVPIQSLHIPNTLELKSTSLN